MDNDKNSFLFERTQSLVEEFEIVDFDLLSKQEQLSLVKHLLSMALLEVEAQNRPLTEWEADTLSGAIGAAMAGMDKLALTKIELSQLKRKVKATPQIWLSNTEKFELQSLQRALIGISEASGDL